MPRCPPGSRRCPPKTGKCHKRSNKTVKRNKTAKKSPEVASASPAADSPMPKLKWIDHLKMCTKKFNIKFGDAMKDPRCLKLYRESR